MIVVFAFAVYIRRRARGQRHKLPGAAPQPEPGSMSMNPLHPEYLKPVTFNANYTSVGDAGVADYEEPVPLNPAYAELDPSAINLDSENNVKSSSLAAKSTRCAYRRNGRSKEQCKANSTNSRPWCAAHTCTGCGDASKPSTKSLCDGCAPNANLDAENYVMSPPPTTTSAYARPGELTLHDYEYDEHNRTTRA